MRVALLQTRQDPQSRAANIQRMIAMIDRAGRGTPPPDLFILPGACDTGGAAPRAGLTEASLQTVSETIAFKAREWGVYIAAGLHIRDADGIGPCAVLFDPDGDRVAWCAGPMPSEGGNSSVLNRVWLSPVGILGVISASAAAAVADSKDKALSGALIAWPCGGAMAAKHGRKKEPDSAMPGEASFPRCGAYWGVVSPAGSSPRGTAGGPMTYVCAPDGRIMASVDHAEEAIVFAEVPIEPAPPGMRSEVCGSDGHAD